MKTNKFFFTALGFLTGLTLGISIIGLWAFTSGTATPIAAGGIAPVTTEVAKSYLKNYTATLDPNIQAVKGFTIDKSQLDAMNAISRENPELTAFRIYLGRDNSTRKVGIVIGVDNTGKDALKNTIYSTDAARVSPCPPICDTTSPIVPDK
jgi:hypothetical protein